MQYNNSNILTVYETFIISTIVDNLHLERKDTGLWDFYNFYYCRSKLIKVVRGKSMRLL